MMRKRILFMLGGLMTILSCEKTPDNPYEGVNYNTDTATSVTPDPTSIIGLHRNIFFPRCAKSGCHDGTFEPDYRTVMSTYSTLVYQPVIKNHCGDDTSQYFKLRVIPYNADSSFLIERLTTATSDYMPSNGNKLSGTEISYIRTWINNGARDQNGNVAVAPNLPPVVNAVFAVDQNPPYTLLDSNRLGDVAYNPWIFHPGTNAYIVFTATDDSTAVPDYTVNQLKLSYDKDDFSNAVTVNAVYNTIAKLWLVPISANNFTANDTVFYRYYVNDGDHASPTEFPRDDYSFYYKYYCSFVVQ
jgi:hypothetical protein